MRKSVAEQLAELATPAPAADPEAADALDDGPGLFDSDEELAEAHTRPARNAPEKRHRRAAIDLDSAAYRGRKTRRQDIFNDGSDSDSGPSEDDSDSPDADDQRQRDAVHMKNGSSHQGSKRGQLRKLAAAPKRASIDQIAEDEWGSGGDESDENLHGNLSMDDSGSEDADASDSEGSDGAAGDGQKDDSSARRRSVHGEGRPKNGAANGEDPGDDSGTGSEDDDSDMGSEEDEDMRGGDGEDGMDANLEGSSDEGDGDEVDEDGWAQLEADFATIQATPAAAKAPAAGQNQAAKAAAVSNQVKLWEKALGVRITLQRGLIAADRLPRGGAYATAVAAADGAAAAIDAAKREAAAVLGECMDTMHELIARTVENADGAAGEGPGAEAAEAASAAGGCAAVWPAVEALEARFAPFRDEEIDRWHRRTLLASGQVAMRGGGGLQALNQPLSHQVAEVLRNPDRAMARTRRRRQGHDRVLCEPGAAPAVEGGEAEQGGDGELGVGGVEERREAEPDVESYDDSAFYQLLLHEFLEAAETDGRVSGVAQVPKSRKVVDRRASKGRKVRYHVMQKLVNFMVPVENTYPEADDRIDALFTNLFGHKPRA